MKIYYLFCIFLIILVTGFMMKNEKAGIELNGHTGQKTRFSTTSLICDQVGQSLLTLKNTGESYLITSPSLTVNGIWYAGTVNWYFKE